VPSAASADPAGAVVDGGVTGTALVVPAGAAADAEFVGVGGASFAGSFEHAKRSSPQARRLEFFMGAFDDTGAGLLGLRLLVRLDSPRSSWSRRSNKDGSSRYDRR